MELTSAPVFIVGCPRSGTGLLRDLLRAHPHLTAPDESYFVPALYRAYGDPRDARAARRLARMILDLCWVRAWGLSLEAEQLAGYRTYAELVSRLFQEHAAREHKRRWCDKTPAYVSEIPTLVEIFPACKVLHIVRDGRDVARSWLRAYFGPRDLYTAALAWRDLVRAGRRGGAAVSATRYTEVRYEELLSAPRETMTRVCAFIDEPFDEAVLAPDFLPRHVEHAVLGSRRIDDVSEREIVGANMGKWRCDLSERDQALFETVAGDLLMELGYGTAGRRRRLSRTERAARRARHTLGFAASYLNTTDKLSWFPSHLRLRWAGLRAIARRRARR